MRLDFPDQSLGTAIVVLIRNGAAVGANPTGKNMDMGWPDCLAIGFFIVFDEDIATVLKSHAYKVALGNASPLLIRYFITGAGERDT